MQATEEIEMVRKLRQGDKEAFTGLFRLYNKMLFKKAFSVCNSQKDAEDLVQELFTTLWNRRESLNPNRPIHTFLWILLRQLIINRYRKSNSASQYINEIIHEQQQDNPFKDIDLRDQLIKAINQLSNPKAKVVIQKFYFEAKSYKDIEAETGIAVTTSKKIMLRSLISLKKMIKFR
jgi:RNA polymerase sigma-70 factor (ECF subfamily)